jgi:hypothetical protein
MTHLEVHVSKFIHTAVSLIGSYSGLNKLGAQGIKENYLIQKNYQANQYLH